MNHPLQALINMGVVPTVTFPPDSRYYGSQTLSRTGPDGRPVNYLARRFVPQAATSAPGAMATHRVQQGDRLDLIAARYLGDPLLFWLICDANGALRPEQLVETPGQTITITTPLGVPGALHA